MSLRKFLIALKKLYSNDITIVHLKQFYLKTISDNDKAAKLQISSFIIINIGFLYNQ